MDLEAAFGQASGGVDAKRCKLVELLVSRSSDHVIIDFRLLRRASEPQGSPRQRAIPSGVHTLTLYRSQVDACSPTRSYGMHTVEVG